MLNIKSLFPSHCLALSLPFRSHFIYPLSFFFLSSCLGLCYPQQIKQSKTGSRFSSALLLQGIELV
jgi:hypothetical protein